MILSPVRRAGYVRESQYLHASMHRFRTALVVGYVLAAGD
jgi:hypothetical protein